MTSIRRAFLSFPTLPLSNYHSCKASVTPCWRSPAVSMCLFHLYTVYPKLGQRCPILPGRMFEHVRMCLRCLLYFSDHFPQTSRGKVSQRPAAATERHVLIGGQAIDSATPAPHSQSPSSLGCPHRNRKQKGRSRRSECMRNQQTRVDRGPSFPKGTFQGWEWGKGSCQGETNDLEPKWHRGAHTQTAS